MHVYKVRSRKDKRGFDLISDVLSPRGACDVVIQTQSAMQSSQRSTTICGAFRVQCDENGLTPFRLLLFMGQVTGDGRQVNDVDLRCQGIGVRGCLCRGRVSKRRLGRV